MKRIKIKQVDAFTSKPFCGNPAGVVTVASGLTDEQMQKIAQEINLSETIFILPPNSSDVNITIRWFSPTTEVELCGHATIAGFFALAEEKKYGIEKAGNYKFKVQTKVGVLPVSVKILKRGDIKVTLFIPVPELFDFIIDKNVLRGIFNCSEEHFDYSLPIMRSDNNVVIPVKGIKSLFELKPDFLKMLEYSKDNNIGLFSLLSLETIDKNSFLHLRCFAPSFGINEDPVTGSIHGEIGVYMIKNGLLESTDGKYFYIAEQGDCMNRPGRVEVSIIKKDKKIDSLSIAGTAVTVILGSMYI